MFGNVFPTGKMLVKAGKITAADYPCAGVRLLNSNAQARARAQGSHRTPTSYTHTTHTGGGQSTAPYLSPRMLLARTLSRTHDAPPPP